MSIHFFSMGKNEILIKEFKYKELSKLDRNNNFVLLKQNNV